MTSLKSGQNCVNHRFYINNKNSSFWEVLHGMLMVLIYYLHVYFIYRVCSWNFPNISNFNNQISKFGSNLTDNPKIVWPRRDQGDLIFSNSRDPWHLVEPEQHQVSKVVVIRIVEGKLRAGALLNPDKHPDT